MSMYTCTCISLYLFSPVWILRTVLILQDYFVFVLSLFYCLVFGVFWHKKYSKCLFLCWYFCYLAGQYCQSESAGQTDIAARVGPPILWDTAWVWGGWRLDWGVEPVYCCNQAQTTIQILTWRPGKRLSLHGVIISYGRVFFSFFIICSCNYLIILPILQCICALKLNVTNYQVMDAFLKVNTG